jgi:hypothetical protein
MTLTLGSISDSGPEAVSSPDALGRTELEARATATIARAERANRHKSADSGELAWGESEILTSYVWMYRATGQTAWLDKLIEHADEIFANLSKGEDGCPGWRTATYSVAIARSGAAPGNRSSASIQPSEQRIYNMEEAAKVTGHTYLLCAKAEGAVEITDQTAPEPSAGAAAGRSAANEKVAVIIPNEEITAIPGVRLKLAGELSEGDCFIISTIARKPLEYVVHDGMILTPIALFIEEVKKKPQPGKPPLDARYREAADRYLRVIERELIPKWEPYWKERQGAGAYLAQSDEAQRFPGVTLPHNQYLALGRTILALYRTTRKLAYRRRALLMAAFFARNLRKTGEAREWNYWDPLGDWDEPGKRMQVREDTSHGTIDIGFVIDAYKSSVFFTREDMEGFAKTFRDCMWNGSLEDPKVGGRVASKGGESLALAEWVRLSEFDPQAAGIFRAILARRLSGGGLSPALLSQALAVLL